MKTWEINMINLIYKKGKAVLVDNQLTSGGESVSLSHWLPLTPR
jgi:hypothetical protein